MKQKNLLYALALGAIVLVQSGCTSYSYTSRSTRVNQNDIYASEQVADVTVDYKKKITATSDFQKFPNQAKQQAIYQCIMDNGVDVIVDPIFKIENRPITGYRATVTGFAGYIKTGKKEIDRMIESGYSREDIEKYLLMTDPSFYQYYYQNGGQGNVYNIKCGGGASAPAPQIAPIVNLKKGGKKAPVALTGKQAAYKKAKQIRDAGIGLTCTGFFCWIGIPMIAAGQKRMNELK